MKRMTIPGTLLYGFVVFYQRKEFDDDHFDIDKVFERHIRKFLREAVLKENIYITYITTGLPLHFCGSGSYNITSSFVRLLPVDSGFFRISISTGAKLRKAGVRCRKHHRSLPESRRIPGDLQAKL